MYINFLSNRPQADGEWQKLHSHAYTRATVCSFVSFTHYLIYLRRWIAKKIRFWCCLFASFVSFSQLIIVIWIKTSVVTILEWIPAMVDTVPLIVWLVYVVLMKNFRCCQRIQQRQSYKLRVHGVNPQSPLKV
jgi:uncharacterized membrane protein